MKPSLGDRHPLSWRHFDGYIKMNTPAGAEYLVVLGWEPKVRAVTKWVERGSADGVGRDPKAVVTRMNGAGTDTSPRLMKQSTGEC